MRLHTTLLLLVLLCLPALCAEAADFNTYRQQTLLEAPAGCPVQLVEINSFYRINPKRNTIRTFGAALGVSDGGAANVGGLDWQITYTNNSPATPVIATEVIAVFFDPWGEYQATDVFFMGETIMPGKRGMRKVKYDGDGAEYYFTEFIFVSRVLMEDGTVYKADLEAHRKAINAQMNADLTLEDLRGPDWAERHARRRDAAVRQAQPTYTRD